MSEHHKYVIAWILFASVWIALMVSAIIAAFHFIAKWW